MTAKGLIFGHNVPTDSIAAGFVWAKELIGFPVEKMVLAYAGSGPSRLAFLAGETNCTGESTLGYNTVIKPLVERGEVVPIFQQGIVDKQGNVVREPAAPPVPTVKELYQQVHGKEPSGIIWKVNYLIIGIRTFGKTVLMPKQTPAELVEVCRKAFIEMVRDPKFLEDAEKESPGAPHLTGEDLARVYPPGVVAPPDVIQFMRKFLTERYDVRFD